MQWYYSDTTSHRFNESQGKFSKSFDGNKIFLISEKEFEGQCDIIEFLPNQVLEELAAMSSGVGGH